MLLGGIIAVPSELRKRPKKMALKVPSTRKIIGENLGTITKIGFVIKFRFFPFLPYQRGAPLGKRGLFIEKGGVRGGWGRSGKPSRY